MQRPRLIDVVLGFHAGDQDSAARLLEVLLAADEGAACRYHLRYGDPVSTLRVGRALDEFMAKRTATFSAAPPAIDVDPALAADESGAADGPGVRTVRTPVEKRRILQWNRLLFESIEAHDAFLVIEPDCVVLKHGWFADISNAWLASSTPIFGHLKSGRIDGREVPTHWAGCSVYDGSALRSLPLARTFRERFPNPWWRERDRPDTTTANNPFWGPHASAWDLSFDYLLFILYWLERSGHDAALEWPVAKSLDRSDLIRCDHKTRASVEEILDRHWGVLPLFHGAKDDRVRMAAAERFKRSRETGSRPLPVGRGAREAGEPGPGRSLSLSELRGRYRGRRCFIIGNGPSLNVTDLRPLANEFTFGLNRIYLNQDRMGFEPTFYCAVNPHVLEQFAADIDGLRSLKFVNERARPWLRDPRGVHFMKSIPRIGFAEDLGDGAWHEGWTVTFCALQAAFHLGFDDVILVGVDHFFARAGAPDQLVVENQADVNHFHPDYFGKGVRWQYPNLERSEQSYRLARSVYERHHRRVRDATVDGRLTVFEKVGYETLFAAARPPSPSPLVVSIIMPARNGEDTIVEAIRSIQAQDLEDWELLIVDDHSTDATAALVEERARLDPRILYSRNEGHGVSMARNQGLERARGEFITFLDADDLYYDWALSARVAALRERPDRLAVHCETEVVGEQGEPLGWQTGASLITFMDAWRNPFHLGALMGRAEFLKTFRFDPGFRLAEDYLFATRILRAGARLERVPGCRVAYRLRPGSTAAADPQALEDAFARVLDLVYGPDPGCPNPLPIYRDGLRDPDREKVGQRRLASLLIQHLLAGRGSAAKTLVTKLGGARFDAQEIEIHLRRAAARHYRCPLRHAWRMVREQGSAALDLAGAIELAEAVPTLARAISAAVATADRPNPEALAGPFERAARAWIDEVRMIHELLADAPSSEAVMVDVGAHRGGSLEPFVEAGWTVHAFEPDERNRQALLARFSDFEGLTVDPRAVSSVVRPAAPFWVSDESTGISGLTPHTGGHRPQGPVGVTTLESFAVERSITRVDFLKVDVEGHELMVLEGVPWARFRPRVILCEFEDRKTVPRGFDHVRLGDFLLDRGYEVLISEWHPVVRYGMQHDWKRIAAYPSELLDPLAWGNFIAFRDHADLERFRAMVPRSIAEGVPPVSAAPERATAMSETPPESPSPVISALAARRSWPARVRERLSAWGGVSTVVSGGLAISALGAGRYSAPLLAGAFLVFLAREVVRARRLDALLHDREARAGDLRRRVADLNTRSRRNDREASTKLDGLTADLGRLAAQTRGELRRQAARLRAFGGGNVSLFRSHERELSRNALDRIRNPWLTRLGLELSPEALGYMAHRISVIEDRCQGRLAAATDTEILRCLVALAVRGKSLDILEIGVLFGVHAACVHDLCRDAFEVTHLTLIDPLDGYYGAGARDPRVGLPVSRQILTRNLRAADVPEESSTVIERRSEDPEARIEAARRTYDVLYIDGDHRLEAVRGDFEAYGGLVRPGGFIVFDDYGAPEWPGVGAVVDNEARRDPRLEFLGAEWQTAVFRVRKA